METNVLRSPFTSKKVRFLVDGVELERVDEFKYLGRIVLYKDNDSPYIEYNLRKAKQQWNAIASFLKREGASAKCMAIFYVTASGFALWYCIMGSY